MTFWVSSFLVAFLGFICLYVLVVAFIDKDKSLIWSPLTFLTLSILYYCVLPEYFNSREFEGYNVSGMALSFHIGALVSYICILIGFFFIHNKSSDNWKRWNRLFTKKSAFAIGLMLFLFAMACHVPYRGLHFSIFVTDNNLVEYDYSSVGLGFYFINMIAILCASCCLLLFSWRRHKLLLFLILWITLVTFIVSGFRYRIVILVISMFSVYYLKDKVPHKINLLVVALVSYVCYMGFNVMDHARNYSNGIRLDVIKTMNKEDLTSQAGETERVYNYSIMVMDTYEREGVREYFAPIINAIFIPIPRALFPWKPDASYLYTSADAVMEDGGTASVYVYFVEAFMAFGWIGIVINGLFIGWLSRRFWNNYRNNPRSIGAILALALYNGVTYVIVSRGYLAQEFSCFMSFVCVPFWLSMFFKTLIYKTKK